VSTRVFGHFPEWLEKQTLDHVEDHLCLLNLYIMAERLETPVRQNLIVDKLYRRRLNEFNDVDMFNGATSTDRWTGGSLKVYTRRQSRWSTSLEKFTRI
jgi:hypothetical protein